MKYTNESYLESAQFIKNQLGEFSPDILLILGSGLGFLAEHIEEPIFIPYDDIPYFQTSTAPGHIGRYVFGKLAGKKVVAMQGRLHLYEGLSPEASAYPVRVAHLLGARALILSCATGGVNLNYNVGDLACLTDYINLTHPGPMVGFDKSAFETRFFDMSAVFDREYLSDAKHIAQKHDITLHDAVYFYMPGPQFETPAEIRAIRTLGGDVVGMSCVHETIMARRCGMRIMGFALITNMAAGILNQPLTEDEVLVEGHKAKNKFSTIVLSLLQDMTV